VNWGDAVKTVDVPQSSFEAYNIVISNPTAKYIRIQTPLYGAAATFDNITVTEYGKKIAKLSMLQEPSFLAQAGEEAIDYMLFQGSDMTSGLNLKFKSGEAFSLESETIALGKINNKFYMLPIKFQAETGSYFVDTLVVSGNDFMFEREFPVKGVVLQDIIYQDFNGVWVQQGSSYSDPYSIDGWETTGTYVNYGGDRYEGAASLGIPNGRNIISVPKSGGVGTISFYYHTDYYSSTLRVETYETLDGEPTVVSQDSILPSGLPYDLFEVVVNDSAAVYVKILNSATDYSVLYIDNVAVTANKKGVPQAIAPKSVSFTECYPEDKATKSIELSFENVEEVINLSLAEGSSFSIDKTTITPVDGVATEELTITYTPSGKAADSDILFLKSKGLLADVQINLSGVVYADKIVQDFNKTGWLSNSSDGDAILDGWVITNSQRMQGPGTNAYEGEGALRMSFSYITNYNVDPYTVDTIKATLTSPAKLGGINNVEFYYRAEPVDFYLQTSQNGEEWTNVDTLMNTANISSEWTHYSKAVKDPEAKYFRIQLYNSSRTAGIWWVYVDSVAIDALPYIRRVGEIQEVSTTVAPLPISIQVAGFLEKNATITLEGGVYGPNEEYGFELESRELTPEEVADGAITSFNVIFKGGEASDVFDERIVIEYEGGELVIPVFVDYTKPYLKVVNTIEAIETHTVPVIIPVEVIGLLNTDATIAVDGAAFTLETNSLAPEELEDSATVVFNVTFTAGEYGEYTGAVTITNPDVAAITIPLSVIYKDYGVGINKVTSGNVSVYVSKNGILNVLGASAGTPVTVLNVQGQSLFTSIVNSSNEQFEVGLTTGVYIVKVGDKTWKVLK
jgi:hypothetical protein